MKRLLLVLVAAVGLSGCVIHPVGLRPPHHHPGKHHRHRHGHVVHIPVPVP